MKKKQIRASMSDVKKASELISRIRKEIGEVFYGHEKIVTSLIRSVLCGGHVLLEGIPGIAKTLVIKALSKVSGSTSKRIQFTIDLLPTDIVGLTSYNPKKGFEVVKGPIFANFIIADEVNRSSPKTQSALIEAMQEGQVTIGKETFKLPDPFFVMANENPIETEGVYPLPEAQIDRFLFKLKFSYPEKIYEARIMEENVTFRKFEDFNLKTIASPKKILELQKLTHKIYLDEKIKEYILKIVRMTRDKNFQYSKYINFGASPRASIALFIASKSEALLQGRNFVLPIDIKAVAHDVLRHRLILSYKAQAEGVDTDKIIDYILKNTEIN
jgi:MoxR-like ATPase|tara:strand:+ start:9011 stop:9997 length:987 start_codon:yes stop_codon:yes gene_type:complete